MGGLKLGEVVVVVEGQLFGSLLNKIAVTDISFIR